MRRGEFNEERGTRNEERLTTPPHTITPSEAELHPLKQGDNIFRDIGRADPARLTMNV